MDPWHVMYAVVSMQAQTWDYCPLHAITLLDSEVDFVTTKAPWRIYLQALNP
jgi:hypothetical protein